MCAGVGRQRANLDNLLLSPFARCVVVRVEHRSIADGLDMIMAERGWLERGLALKSRDMSSRDKDSEKERGKECVPSCMLSG
jgi:hypothetical protein